LLIRIGELRVNSIKFDDDKDGKGKGEVLGLRLAYWKGLRGIVLEVVKVIEVRRQLKKLYRDRRKQIQLIKRVLVADYAKPVNLGVFNCCIPKRSNQIDTAHLIKIVHLNTKSLSRTTPLLVGFYINQSQALDENFWLRLIT